MICTGISTTANHQKSVCGRPLKKKRGRVNISWKAPDTRNKKLKCSIACVYILPEGTLGRVKRQKLNICWLIWGCEYGAKRAATFFIRLAQPIGHLHHEFMRHHLYKNDSYDFAFKKAIGGSYLKQNNSDLVSQPPTIFVMSTFVAGNVTKMWFLKLWITFFWTEILHLNFKEIVEWWCGNVFSTSERTYLTCNNIQAKSSFGGPPTWRPIQIILLYWKIKAP